MLKFALSGGGNFLLVGMAIGPLVNSMTCQHWEKATCEIVSSNVDVTRKSYRPIIEFEFSFHGERYVSDNYDFTSLNVSRSRAQQVVDEHAVGDQKSCFVDPDEPQNAVLVREYDFSLFGFLFPLIFVACGALMIFDLFHQNQEP